MTLKLRVSVDGEQVLKKAFRQASKNIEDLSPVFRGVQKVFYDIEKENFQSLNTSGASGKWKPLSSAYEKQKTRKYGTFVIFAGVMRASDALYKSLTGEREHSITIIEKQEAAFGTNLPYAKAHQAGAARLPQRKVIDPSPKQLKRVGNMMKSQLVYRMIGTGLRVDEKNFGLVTGDYEGVDLSKYADVLEPYTPFRAEE